MKRFLVAVTVLVAALLFAAPASARNRAFGFCEVGNKTVVVSGLNGVPKVQASYPGCTVTVYLTGTLTLATLFSDNSSTPLANPFTASASTGYWFFYADDSRYDVVESGGGLATPFTYADVSLFSGGVSSITVGDLPPLFTTNVANPTTSPAVTYTLSNAAADTVFGRCTGSMGAPSFCSIVNAMLPAPGSNTQLIFNGSNLFAASQDLTWNDTTKLFTISTGGVPLFKIGSDSGASRIILSNVSQPLLENATGTGFFITSQANQDFRIGPANDTDSYVLSSGTSGVFGLPVGTIRTGTGSHQGVLLMNDGTSSAGVFQGPQIMAGNGTPEASFPARVGSIFERGNGSTGTSIYVKETGTGTTGWVEYPRMKVQQCGTMAACAPVLLSNPQLVFGTVALDGGSPSAATITGISPAFTSTATYACTVTDLTNAANNLLSSTPVSGSSFSIAGPNTAIDTISWVCVGN